MSLKKRLGAMALAVAMALALTACSPRELLSDMILTTVDLLGLRSVSDDEEESTRLEATAGGSITFPEGMDTASRLNGEVYGDTLYIAFNGIQAGSTDYFVAGSDTVTLTGYATTDSPSLHTFKAAIWQLSEDRTKTSYVPGTTVYFATGGDCSTATVSGLTPGQMYKVYISYDSYMYYITGGVTMTGAGSEELTTLQSDEE